MNKSPDTNEFLRLMMNHQRHIYGYILKMVPNRDLAQDLFQETMLVMWSKFVDYKPNTNFLAWGIQIARYKVLQAHWQKSRDQFKFTPEAMAAIERKSESFTQEADEYVHALRGCVQKLGSDDGKLVQWRYEEEIPVKDIAAALNRTVQAVYKRYTRIHMALMRCIERRIKMGGGIA